LSAACVKSALNLEQFDVDTSGSFHSTRIDSTWVHAFSLMLRRWTVERLLTPGR